MAERRRPGQPCGLATPGCAAKAIDALRRSRSAARRTEASARELLGDDSPAVAHGRSRADGSLALTDEGFDPGDERLRLVLLCCHPALDLDAQVALTLRLVGGLTTEEIASAFLVPTPTVAQRISRAKRKIRDAAIPMHLPSGQDDESGAAALGGRLVFVRTVLYLIFNEGYLSRSGVSGSHRLDLCEEAIRLADLLARLTDGDSETLGLLALLRFTHARREARFDSDTIVLLGDQDRDRWHRAEIEAANRELCRAVSARQPGPLQVQAVIASLHSNAASAADTDWSRIVALYDQLIAMRPDPVVGLNRAAAIGVAAGAQAGLDALDAALRSADGGRLDRLHLTHSARGEMLRRSGRSVEAETAFRRAHELATNPAERTHLARRLATFDVV